MEPKTGKRIVSKGEYIRRILRRTFWIAWSALLCLVVAALLILLLPVLVICALFDVITGRRPPIVLVIYPQETNRKSSRYKMTYLVSEGMITLVQTASRSFKTARGKAAQINLGVPLTRANTADLPAPDSLVRASSEPMQAQEAVLLRAAAEERERHEEQLMRASVSFSASRSGRPGQERERKMEGGLAGFWYRFKNRFRIKSGPGEPLHFLHGSEEELRRVGMCQVSDRKKCRRFCVQTAVQ